MFQLTYFPAHLFSQHLHFIADRPRLKQKPKPKQKQINKMPSHTFEFNVSCPKKKNKKNCDKLKQSQRAATNKWQKIKRLCHFWMKSKFKLMLAQFTTLLNLHLDHVAQIGREYYIN